MTFAFSLAVFKEYLSDILQTAIFFQPSGYMLFLLRFQAIVRLVVATLIKA